MDFNHYQEQTQKTAVYPEDKAVEYLALGLNGEAGEVAEKIKKVIRGDREIDDDLVDELGDVLWYLARLLDEIGEDFDDVANRNLSKLLDRKDRDVLKGSGDDR